MSTEIRKHELVRQVLDFSQQLAVLGETPADVLPEAFRTPEAHQALVQQMIATMQEIQDHFGGTITLGLNYGYQDLSLDMTIRVRMPAADDNLNLLLQDE
jgi:hypothetical protein